MCHVSLSVSYDIVHSSVLGARFAGNNGQWSRFIGMQGALTNAKMKGRPMWETLPDPLGNSLSGFFEKLCAQSSNTSHASVLALAAIATHQRFSRVTRSTEFKMIEFQ